MSKSIPRSCILCKHSTGAYYQLEGRMAVSCAVLKKDVPERLRKDNCEHFELEAPWDLGRSVTNV